MRRRFKYFEEKKFKYYLSSNIFYKNLYTRYLYKNLLIPYLYRQVAILFLLKFNKKIFFSKLNCVCLETGKTRSVLINFKVSRLIFKVLLSEAVLNGVYKFS